MILVMKPETSDRRRECFHWASLISSSALCLLLVAIQPTNCLLFGARRKAVLPISLALKQQQVILQQQQHFQQSVTNRNSNFVRGSDSRRSASSESLNGENGSSSSSSSNAVSHAVNGEGNVINGGSEQAEVPVQSSLSKPDASEHSLKPWQSNLTRIGMILYIASLCVALPLTLIPQRLFYMMGLMTKKQKEHYAVATSAFCARWMLRFIPFCRLTFYPYHHPNPVESVWVCNHSSLLDVFLLLASDRQLRGPTRRPIKIVYWKQLEKNPICNLMFKQAGFIPVQMVANKAGEDNDYDKSSFKKLLKDSKEAFKDGFDIGILPEGQLNPTPEKGLLPVFSGAFTLARMSRRPIQMMALNGVHNLWHPLHGMHCIGRHVKLRVYPYNFRFSNSTDFVETFKTMVGHFALHGKDLSEEEQTRALSKTLAAAASGSK